MSSTLVIDALVDLELFLDPKNEARPPCLHVYLSTHVNDEDWAVIDLKPEWEVPATIRGARRWRFNLSGLRFKVALGPGANLKLKHEAEGRDLNAALRETTKFNIDVFSHIRANHGELVLK